MSTKNSLCYVEFERKSSLHIYKEMYDEQYYIEDEQAKILIPEEELAKKLAKVIREFRK